MPFEQSQPLPSYRGWLTDVLALFALLFLAAHFVHLSADLPNRTPWIDGAKTTDEGWYAGAAVHHFIDGHWYLPGSFNPAVSIPVWPAILAVWFQFTGVGMVPARVLMLLFYAASLFFMCLLVRRYSPGPAWAAALLLMAVNPYCFVFDRLSILEPLVVFWLLFALWIADRTSLEATARHLLLGVVVVLMVLTKTTGAFLVPAILYQLWATNDFPPLKRMARPVTIILGTTAILWLAYDLAVVRPHFLADYKLMVAANKNRVYLRAMPYTAWRVVVGSFTMDPFLFPAAVAILALSAGLLRRLWRNPLFGSAALAMFGYMAFIWYHAKLYEARYYLVLAIPITILVVLGISELVARDHFLGSLAAFALTLTTIAMAQRTITYARDPRYNLRAASNDIAAHIHADRTVPNMLLSNSGDDITLYTGVPAISWEFNTEGLIPLVDHYHPGWYAEWSPEEDPVKTKLAVRYHLTEVARYRLFDLPLKDWMVLYRLDPIPAPQHP